jgi:hypothetical protein
VRFEVCKLRLGSVEWSWCAGWSVVVLVGFAVGAALGVVMLLVLLLLLLFILYFHCR